MKPFFLALAAAAACAVCLSACQSPPPAGNLFPFDHESADYREGFQKGFLEGIQWSEAIADQRQLQKP